MKQGLTLQVALLSKQTEAGEIQVMTLAQAGQWFRQHYQVTPPTSVVCLDDWKQEGRKTVWYDSRCYRLNLLWENGSFHIRDVHCFNENVAAVTHDAAMNTTALAYETMPMMDGALWSGTQKAGMWPVLLSTNTEASPLAPDGPPVVKELNRTDLSIRQPLLGGGIFSMICTESKVICSAMDERGKALNWAWDLVGGAGQKSAVQAVTANDISYQFAGTNYKLKLSAGSCEQAGDGIIRLHSDKKGKIGLDLNVTK
ncbi:MAG TPA: hypothetical protein VG347_19655 [Verrucomicrobiae bacterium]|nr:hypothetical protein [Verrucomicrobiae bacterium]